MATESKDNDLFSFLDFSSNNNTNNSNTNNNANNNNNGAVDASLNAFFDGTSLEAKLKSPRNTEMVGGIKVDLSTMQQHPAAQQQHQPADQAYQQGLALYQYGFASGFDAINAANLFEQANPTTTNNNNTNITIVHLDALCKTGECCLWGKGVQQNQKKAFECFQKAAAKGHTLSMYYMGYCYLMGIGGVNKDATQAQTWFDQALKTWNGLAGSGDEAKVSGKSGDATATATASSTAAVAEAQFWLGWCHEQSYGFDVPNFELAVSWYEKAAKGGHSNAMYYLAMYLKNAGANDKENVAKAKKLLEEAAKLNHPGAKKELKKEAEAHTQSTSPNKK